MLLDLDIVIEFYNLWILNIWRCNKDFKFSCVLGKDIILNNVLFIFSILFH